MIGNPGWLQTPGKRRKLPQIIAVQRVGRSRRERYAVHNDRVIRPNLIDYLKWTATRAHEVFRNHLKPVHHWPPLEDLGVMRPSKAHAKAQKRKFAMPHCHSHCLLTDWMPGLARPAIRPAACAGSDVRLLRVTTLLRTFVGSRSVDPTLTLARVLTFAGV